MAALQVRRCAVSSSSPDADRNLLFAVLALQADCLTPARFVEACTLWASEKATPIADLLVGRGWLGPDERADVDRLLERKLKKHAGDARVVLAEVTADAAVRRSIAALPDEDVRASLVSAPHTNGHYSRTPSPPGHIQFQTDAFVPREEDRYTLTRLHATGGIGRVWLARDSALGRDVALKDLRPERAGNPDAAARFMTEARVTGRLEHPGIVPIYELGSRGADGQPFYTMRFVRGQTLREKLTAYHQKRERGEAGPLEFRELLTAFVGVCNAIAYAHSQGVIHRDLKPANVVLGGFGEVMVLDWGLAREMGNAECGMRNEEEATESAIPNSDFRIPNSQTMEGQVLGTPAYMAPEQADGRLDDLGERTDVYGLGAILYEILTGNPPFDGPTTEVVLSRVRTLDPAQPIDLVPTTPRALEAVCLKALRKNPADRYASTKDLADEVSRVLADEPVTVYREPALARAWRWARRHRTPVTALVVALAVAVPGLGAGMVVVDQSERRERAARKKEEAARKDAETAQGKEKAARERAEVNYRRSLRAADAMTEELARGIRPIAGTQSKDVLAILDRSKQIYDELLADPDVPPDALASKARALVLFAELYRDTNRSGPSRKAAEESITLFDRLLADRPADRPLRVGRAKARHRLAWATFDQGYHDDSLAGFRAVIRELEDVGPDEDPVATAHFLASAYTFVGNHLWAFGDYDGAEPAFRQGLELRRRAVAARDTADNRAQLALNMERFGLFLIECRPPKDGANPEGLALLRQGRVELEAVCQPDPGNAGLHLRLVQHLTSLAQSTPDRTEAAASHAAGQKLVDRFAARDPDHLIWRREALRLRLHRMENRVLTADREDDPNLRELRRELMTLYESSLATIEEIVRQDPENYFWTADVAHMQYKAAEAHLRFARRDPAGNHLATAERLARAAVQTCDQLLSRSPHNVDHARERIVALHAIFNIRERQNDPAGSAVANWNLNTARLGLYQRLAAKYPTVRSWQTELRGAYGGSGLGLRVRERDEGWKEIVASPEAVATAVRLASLLTDPPAGTGEDVKKWIAEPRKNAVSLLERFGEAGVLPPDGKKVLELLRIRLLQ
jgi:hypothetical protein